MIISILIVCFTTPKPSKTCHITLEQTVENSIINDSRPLSVAVGHFNNDSWLDIAVANSGTNEIGILLGYGDGSFATPIMYSTGAMSRPMSIAVGDFNRDHWMDIVVANYDSHTVGIFIGHGDGTFFNQKVFFIGSSRPLSIAIGDFNNDTWLDIVVANNGTNSISILFGNENGYFEMQITYSTGYDSLPYSVAVADFNNDNQLDIAVANYGINNIGIFLGYGNGTFTSQMTFATNVGSGPYSVTIGNLNNDDQLDIIVANHHANNIGVFLGYGNGTFATQRTYFLGSRFSPCSVAMGYINKDNHLDIVVSNNGNDSVSVLVGNGDGTFATPTMHSISDGSSPIGLAIGDFDNDKQSDVVVSNSGTNNIFILLKYTAISSKNPLAYSTGDGSIPWVVAIKDFNNDNYLDIAVVDYGTNSIGILLGYGNGSFGEQTSFYTGDGSHPRGFAIADINNDNFLDIVVANFNVDYASLLLGYGNGSFDVIKWFSYNEPASLITVAAGDFNNDNRLDIVLPSFSYNTITIFLGYANGSFEYLKTYSTGDGSRPTFVAVGDFNNDNRLDIVVSNAYLDNIGIFLGYGNGTFAPQMTYSTGVASIPQQVGLGDFNNDNCLDIAVANTGRNYVSILLGHCNGTFFTQTVSLINPESNTGWIAVADANNDQWLDLVFTQSSDSIGIFLGYGNGTFATQLTFSTGTNSVPYCIAVGDLNNDNRMDVATANYATNNVAILFGHPNSMAQNQTMNSTSLNLHSDSVTAVYFNHTTQPNLKFSNGNTDSMSEFLLGEYYFDFLNKTPYSTGSSSRPYSIVVGDFNNDTYMDIVVTNSGNENVGILLGYGNASFANEVTYSIGSGSRPQYVISGDFNKDDHLDIAVANSVRDSISVLLGYGNGSFTEQSSIPTGFGSNPSSIAIGDINNDNWLDLVVTNKRTDTIGLILGFNYASFPSPIRSSTGNVSGPTSVAVGDFNDDGRLDIATANYKMNNVGILLGYGNGSFTSPVMYANVNGSHPWAVVIGDFNNDNKLDITVAMWGIDQMGVILGNGDGTFGEPQLYFIGIGTRPVSIAIGDLNNDHQLDITTANYGTSSVSVFFGYGDGTFTNATMYSTGDHSGPSSINVDDLNKDNYLDIFVANEVTYNVGALYGNGDGTFRNVVTYSSDPDSSPEYALSGDFNNDSLPDIAVALFGAGNIGVFLGYGNGTFSSITLYTYGFDSGAQYLAFNDLNNDNYIDIAVANINTDDIGILFGNGDGTFRSIALYSTDSDNTVPYAIAIADFNNDTRLDIVFADPGNEEAGVFLGNGVKPFGSYTSLLHINGSSPSSITLGDFNNDTSLDIAISNSGIDNVGILLGHGNGSFEDIKMYATGDNSVPLSIALDDFNEDTLLDIAVANSNTNNIGIFLGYGNGSFANLTTYPTGIASQPVSILIGDFNHDSFADLIVANSGTNNVGILIGYGNGTFANQILYPVGYGCRPNSVAFGDFNNDSWIDIAVVNYAAGNIKILLNCPPL